MKRNIYRIFFIIILIILIGAFCKYNVYALDYNEIDSNYKAYTQEDLHGDYNVNDNYLHGDYNVNDDYLHGDYSIYESDKESSVENRDLLDSININGTEYVFPREGIHFDGSIIMGLGLCLTLTIIAVYELKVFVKLGKNKDSSNIIVRRIIIAFMAIIWAIISFVPIYTADEKVLWEISPMALFPIAGIMGAMIMISGVSKNNALGNNIMIVIAALMWGVFFGGIMLVAMYGPLFLHNLANFILYVVGVICIAILYKLLLKIK